MKGRSEIEEVGSEWHISEIILYPREASKVTAPWYSI